MSRPTSDTPDEFALAIAREIRKELGARRMSGRALARELDRSEKYVRDRINDRFEFSLNDLEAFARFIGERPEDFVARVESEPMSAPALTVADVVAGGDDYDEIEMHERADGVKSAYGKAAARGRRKTDQPHAE